MLGEGVYDARTLEYSRANTTCRRAASCKPPRSMEEATLAKFNAASPQIEAPIHAIRQNAVGDSFCIRFEGSF